MSCRRTRGCALLLGIVLGATPLPLMAAPAEPGAAKSELEAGLAAYAREDFAKAMGHFERAYALDPSPQSLYAWAQAARSAGDCATAVTLYRRFLDGGATGDSRVAAVQNEARCREQLASDAAADAIVVPPPIVVEPVDPPPVQPDAPASAPRSRDRVGPALVGVGAAVLAAGAVVVGVGGARQREQMRTRDYDRFDALDPRIDRHYIAGGVTLGVGAVLLTVGAVRMALTRRRARARAITLAPVWTPDGTTVLVLRIAPR